MSGVQTGPGATQLTRMPRSATRAGEGTQQADEQQGHDDQSHQRNPCDRI